MKKLDVELLNAKLNEWLTKEEVTDFGNGDIDIWTNSKILDEVYIELTEEGYQLVDTCECLSPYADYEESIYAMLFEEIEELLKENIECFNYLDMVCFGRFSIDF